MKPNPSKNEKAASSNLMDSYKQMKASNKQGRDNGKMLGIFEEYESYKRQRAVHVILVSIIVVMVFIQLCFSVRIYEAIEKEPIKKIQEYFNINHKPMFVLQQVSLVDSEHVNILILMAIFTFMYGYDYMIGMGLLSKYLLGMIAFKLLGYAMRDPRPFWLGELGPDRTANNEIVGYKCDSTFGMPDLTVTQLFWFIINFQDIIRKSQIKIHMLIDKVFVYGFSILLVASIVVKYVCGQLFVLQAVMVLLLCLILLQASKYFTIYIRKAIERCTVGASLEKKYVLRYYVMLMIIAIVDLVLIITNESYDHQQLKYLENIVGRGHPDRVQDLPQFSRRHQRP